MECTLLHGSQLSQSDSVLPETRLNWEESFANRLFIQLGFRSDECDGALCQLIDSLLNCVVLSHPDFSQPFIRSIDASLDGLGAELSQVPTGEKKVCPIAFASKTLSSSEKNYPAHRL